MNNISKKRIGILTLIASDNCGSLLQAYALRKYLIEEFQCDADVINFNPPESKRMYGMFRFNIFKHPRRTIFYVCNYFRIKKQIRDYAFFRKKYICTSKLEYTSSNDLALIDNEYDLIVVGSDQVWNINMEDFNDAYFLKWVKRVPKYSYAASLGKCVFTNKVSVSEFIDIFGKYSDISVRESTAVIQFKTLLGKIPSVLVDPTLLLTRNNWEEIIGERIEHDEYIFFYSYAYCDDEINKIVRDYANKNKTKIIVINPSKWLRKKPSSYGFDLCESSGPIAFLNLIKYAKRVFVQSFHGVIFSFLLQKDFYFLCEPDGIDPRLGELFDLLNAKERIVRKVDDIPLEIMPPINYSEELKKRIAESKVFLNKMVVNK